MPSVAQCLAWILRLGHRIEEHFATGLLTTLHLEFAIGPPGAFGLEKTRFLKHCRSWHMVLRRAPNHTTSFTVGIPLSKEFRGAELGRDLSFSFGFSLVLWIVFHSTLISSRALTIVVRCTHPNVHLLPRAHDNHEHKNRMMRGVSEEIQNKFLREFPSSEGETGLAGTTGRWCSRELGVVLNLRASVGDPSSVNSAGGTLKKRNVAVRKESADTHEC